MIGVFVVEKQRWFFKPLVLVKVLAETYDLHYVFTSVWSGSGGGCGGFKSFAVFCCFRVSCSCGFGLWGTRVTWGPLSIINFVFNLLRRYVSSICVFGSFSRRALPRGLGKWRGCGLHFCVSCRGSCGVRALLRGVV